MTPSEFRSRVIGEEFARVQSDRGERNLST
jgi:hypothetical protein